MSENGDTATQWSSYSSTVGGCGAAERWRAAMARVNGSSARDSRTFQQAVCRPPRRPRTPAAVAVDKRHYLAVGWRTR